MKIRIFGAIARKKPHLILDKKIDAQEIIQKIKESDI